MLENLKCLQLETSDNLKAQAAELEGLVVIIVPNEVSRLGVLAWTLTKLEEMQRANRNFDPSTMFNRGGIGKVFKGILNYEAHVAVKELCADPKQGVFEFLTEINTISDVRHPNLVELIGCCSEEPYRFVFHELLENNILERALSARKGHKAEANRKRRLEIALDIAQCLVFLHEGTEPRIVYRDMKPSNILLDMDFTPKIGDFGLAKLFPDSITHISTKLAGTTGYLAPEYVLGGQLTSKADVYSFGVLILEKLSGLEGYSHDGRRVSLEEIRMATCNFDQSTNIGQGGFGKVYKGILKEGKQAAVKALCAESKQRVRKILRDFNLISNVRHRNLVELIGFSGEGAYRVVVYEFLENNSLERALLARKSHTSELKWTQRLKICIDVAQGLAYLHEGTETRILHRDIKSSNILLDKHFTLKIADFGFTKLSPGSIAHKSTKLAGTTGYIAPEYFWGDRLTSNATDVYSFGVVLFETLCGRSSSTSSWGTTQKVPLDRPRKRWLYGSSMMRRLVEPLDIADYYKVRTTQIKISIKIRPGKTISLVVSTSDTIRNLKLKIPPSEWIHRGDLPDLFYNGECLNDNHTLDSYNISWSSTLECRLGLKISVRTMSEKTVFLEVDSSDTTIGSLKAKIKDKEGVPQYKQMLFFDGRQLENNCTLADYKIEDGYTLLLMFRSKRRIPIYVRTHTEKTISLEVKSSDTIGELKIKIKEVDDILPYKQNLFFVGEQLLDNKCTLTDYNIHPESTLFLLPVCRGRMKIYVETIHGNTVVLDVISRYTIREVKSLIQDKEGIRLHEQILVYEGQKLDDSRTLVSYLIQDERTLRLVDDTSMRTELMRIHIEIVATGKTIPLQVETFDTINSVKFKIQSEENIPFELQRLFLPQIQLKDDLTLADYYIQNDSTLYLVVTLIKIFVKTAHRDIIALDVDISDTILNVKAKIQDVEEIPREHQTLLLAEEQLKDSLTLAKYCIKNESTLHLLVTSDKLFVDTISNP